MENYILQMTPSAFYSRATNMTCHNYCNPPSAIPIGVKSLLGLGLKYCIKAPRPTNKLDTTIDRFKNDVRRISFWKFNPPEEEEGTTYIPELYIKGNWEPRDSTVEIEKCITNFECDLRAKQKRYNKPTLSNLKKSQWEQTKTLKNHDEYIVIEADKNLGGCILNRPIYNGKGVSEHLGNTNVYKPLTKIQAMNRHRIITRKMSIFAAKWFAKKQLSKAENHFLIESIHKYPDNIAKFRMSLKAHKTPWKMRPIVCCAGTMLNNLSRWLDYWFQKLKPLLPTYIKDSNQLLEELASLGALPPNAKLATADANSMYTNIDTDHAILVIGLWLDSLQINNQLPPNFPLGAIKEAMELVMRNNIFEWGDMYFLQLLGTAMGTSAACMWATIYFTVHEAGMLIPKYDQHLLLFKRFIDDMIIVWLDDSPSDDTWNNFKEDTNNFGILTWEFEELSLSVDFLDLTISIEANRITTKTYQKALNLYQYIMPNSAHPPWMMRGIIYSLMRNYYRQNTKMSDYVSMGVKLFQRHVARGWSRIVMKEYILSADIKLRSNKNPTSVTSQPQEPASNKERLFIHLEYHPNDIPRKRIREIYNQHCSEVFERVLSIKQTTVCYSRAKNIKDTVTKAKLHQAPGQEASKFYSGELSS